MKLLTTTFGYGSPGSVLVVLRWTGKTRLNKTQIKKALLQHSCYPPVIEKIITCMQCSGHYECCLRKAVFEEIINHGLLQAAGIQVDVLEYA